MKSKSIIVIAVIYSLLISSNNCDICFKELGESYLRDAWGNKYHEEHLKKGTFCNTCSRIISKRITRGGFQFNDGRFMCNLCEAHIVKNNSENLILESINSVIEILLNKGIHLEKDQFDIKLVDKDVLQSSMYGLTNHNPSDLKATTLIDNKKYIINILWGLHQLEFQGVLAHELMHIWGDYHNIKLSNSKLEGFCNTGSAFIYRNSNTELSKILLRSLEENNDPVYGHGYKYINVMIKKYGWKDVVNRLINHNHDWSN